MDWIFLILAGLLEIVWAVELKYTEGFTKLIPSIITISAMTVSFLFLSISMKSIPLGTSYAIWTGIGSVGAAVFGMIWLGESASAIRIACILLIVAGMVGLKLSSSH